MKAPNKYRQATPKSGAPAVSVIFPFAMSEAEIIKILELGVADKLPKSISDNSDVKLSVVKELYDSGYLNANDHSTLGGPSYGNISINPNGREYLKQLQKEHFEASPRGKISKIGDRLLGKIEGLVFALIIAWIVSKYIK